MDGPTPASIRVRWRKLSTSTLGALCLLALWLAPAASATTPVQYPVTGTVYAIAPDGGGGYYAGGQFTVSTFQNAIHVKSDGTLDSAWSPNPNGPVRALAVSGSGTSAEVYLGGHFTIGTIHNAARVSGAGVLDASWNPNPGVADTIYSLALTNSDVYLGGSFSITAGATVNNAARVSRVAGTLDTTWAPGPIGTVYALAFASPNVYLGGAFTLGARTNAARVNTNGTIDTGWAPDPDATVEAVATAGSTVYLGGQFVNVTGQGVITGNPIVNRNAAGPQANPNATPRRYAAAVGMNNGGVATTWNPNPNGFVHALAATPSTVYFGGDFTTVRGMSLGHSYVAADDTAGESDTGWNGGATQPVYALAVANPNVYIGGTSTSSAPIGAQHALSVSKLGSGSGTVTSDVGGISCGSGSSCSANVDNGTSVTLTEAPSSGSGFTGWSGGGCSGTATTCVVAVHAATAVTATFAIQRLLSVNIGGSGSGLVTSSPAGLSCSQSCTHNFDEGSAVTLTANPAPGSRFAGWLSAECTGTGTCTVTMSAAKSVSASFVAQHVLTVSDAGSGAGGVTSDVPGISCPPTCSQSFDSGNSVTLSATPATGSTFTGWSGGGCSGSGSCTVPMDADKTVTATFTAQQRVLSVNTGGPGSVSSNPAGIDCGATCAQSYNYGTAITLTASPASGARFAGWSGGGCSGTGTCTVTLNGDTTVSAAFIAQYALAVADAGSGSGTVSDGGAINCGTSCSSRFDPGTAVTLNASPAAGSTFNGWSGGGCSGTGSCTVTLNSDAAVTANFTAQHNLTVNDGGSGSGTVSSNPGSINCGASCAQTYDSGTSVTLTATPANGSRFTGWLGGGCSGTGTCSVAMNGDTTVWASFTKRAAPKCTLRPQSSSVLLSKPKKGKPGKQGALVANARCAQAAAVSFTGLVTEPVGKKPKHGKQKVKTFKLGPVHASLPANSGKALTLSLPQALLTDLKHHAKMSVVLTLSATSPDGTSQVTAKIDALTRA